MVKFSSSEDDFYNFEDNPNSMQSDNFNFAFATWRSGQQREANLDKMGQYINSHGTLR